MTVLISVDIHEDGFSASLLQDEAKALLQLAGKEDYELSLLITDDEAIQHINLTWRQKDKATNVLSFPMGDDEDSPQPMLGDIIISVDTAKREAEDKKLGLQPYLTRLLIHGFVHLLGYDHERSDADYDAMLAMEQQFQQQLSEYHPDHR